MNELLEVWVGGVLDFAQPDIAYANVQGVVVADSTWNGAGFLVHELRVTKVALSLTRHRIADAGQHKQVRTNPRKSRPANIYVNGHIWAR